VTKQLSIVKGMTIDKALRHFNGYTQLDNGQIAVAKYYGALPPAENWEMKFTFKNSIVFGYGVDKHGADTNLTYTHVEVEVNKLLYSPYFGSPTAKLQHAKGGWRKWEVDTKGVDSWHLVEEDSAILTIGKQGFEHEKLVVLAERLREAFRQTMVLVCDTQGNVTEIY